MKKTLMYLVAALVTLSLGVFGAGAAPQDVAVEGSPDYPIYTIYCDYEGPDAVMTPCGSMPASHVHFVGDGSVIKLAPEGNYVYSPDDKLTEFVPKEKETPSWLHRVDITKPWPVALSTITPKVAGGWIEYAYTNTQSNLAMCDAKWKVPGEPPVAGGQTMGLFVGIEDRNATWILQPVLVFGESVAGGDPDDWTGVAFAVQDSNAYFGPVISCNVGDIIFGYVSYNELNGDKFHSVTFEDQTTGRRSLLSFWGAFPTSNCIGVVTLEGYNFSGNQHVPYNTLFKNVRYVKKDGSQIKWPTMYKKINDYGVLTGLGVDVFFSGSGSLKKMNIRLRTANGGPDW